MREFVRILLICAELILIAAQPGVGHDPSPTNRSSNDLLVQDIKIITTGTSVAGENYSVVCIVDVYDNLTGIVVNASIVKIGEGVVNSSINSGDNSVSISYTPLMTSHSGQYQCVVNISHINTSCQVSYVKALTINTTIIKPVVTVSTHPVDPRSLIEATYLDIVCTVNISDAVNTGVSVDVEWSHNGGSPLTNNSDYTISSLTMLTSDMYTSTLRIESLSITRDNDAMYSCAVSVLPSPVSSYITGNENNYNVILNVADFTADHVIIDIQFPTTPTAGDQFAMTCNINTPERLVHDLTRLVVIWSYDFAREQRVNVRNSDATIGNVTRIDNLMLSTLTFNPVKTSDGRKYYCSVIFNDLGVTDHVSRDLNVQIPPPSIVITRSPSTGPVYESTNFNLTCTGTLPSVVDTTVSATVVWIDPQGNTIPVKTRHMITDIISSGNNEFQSRLTFLPIDNGNHNNNFNDTGTYTCQMTISSSDPLIISGINSTTDTIIVQSLPDMQLNIVSIGSPEVGQNLNITCTVIVVERLVVKPTIEITKMNTTDIYLLQDLKVPYSIITDDTGSEYNVTITLEPMRFEDRGVYSCMADFNVTGVNGTIDPTTATYDAQSTVEDFELIVNFPPVTVNMSKEHNNILYVGTPFFLRCIITLSDLVTIPIIVKNQWTHIDMSLPSGLINEATILKLLVQVGSLQYESSLYFNPLYNAHNSGEYYCNFVIIANISDYHYVHNISTKANTTINIENLPSPVVNIMTSGKAELGEEYLLNCTVKVIDRLIVTPTIVWIKDNVNTSLVSDDLKSISVPSVLSNISDTMYSLSLFFSSLNTSDAGQYTCQATITMNEINVTTTNASIDNLALQIPQPVIAISTHPVNASTLVEGTYLDIVCTVSLSDTVNTGVSVIVEWSRNGSSPLTNNSDYTISSVNMLGSHMYISTLRIENLDSTRDNGTMYSCITSVLPSPVSSFITGNKNEKTLSLIISDFSSDHVTSNIIFPTTPLAGDQFTMTCNIRIPETLVYEPSSVIWSYDPAREQKIDVNNSDATIRNVTRIGNLILSTLTLNPVKTSDSRRYYCSSIFNNLGVIDHTYKDLNVQIPPPSMVVRGIPSTGLVYESTNFNLICTGTLPSVVDTPVSATVVWFDPQGNTIPIESRHMITNVTSNGNNEFESTLVFLPIDNGDHNSNFNDTGTYTCQMTISSSDPLIISGVSRTTDEIAVQNLPDMQLNIVSVGSPEVGQNLNITCTVKLMERLVVKPTIQITKMNTTDTYLLQDINVPYLIISDDTGSESNVTITLEPVRFEDRGVYRCIAEFNVTGVNGTIDPTTATYDAQSTVEDYELTVNFPPVTVNMSKEHNNIFYVGTPFFLKCIIRLSDLVTIPIIVRNQWTHNDISLPSGLTNEATILEHLAQVGSLQYESSLYFNPLYNIRNSGEYYCNFVIIANVSDYHYVRNTSTKGNATINVENLPSPVVNIMTSGKAVPGEEYLLNCTVNVIKRLIVTPTIVWIKDNVNTSLVSDDLKSINVPSVLSNISDTMYSLSLFFSSLNTSDAGQYTCQATITVNKINATTANSSIEDLVLQIPQPVIAISTHPVNASTVVEGTYLDIVCTVSLSDTVNTGVSVIVEWSHNGSSPLTNNSDYTISSVTMLRSDMYTSTLRIENLDSTRDNGTMYSCITSVLPSPVSSFITGNKNEKTLSLIISDFSSDHVTSNIIFPTTPVAGDQFTMTCNIRIPETLVYEPSSVIWSYDLARKERVDVNNSDATIRNVTRIGNLILSTLTLNPVKTSDSGRYYCSSIFNNLGVTGHIYRDLNVQIPPPSMVVRGIPSTGLVYESTNFNLICTGTLPSVVDTPVSATVVWFDPQGNTIPIESRRIITDVTSNRNNEFESTLMFLPIDNGDHNSNFNDTGTYTCQMNISSSNPLIISGINNTTETITVQNLPDMQLNIVSVGSPEVGQNLNITCTVRVAERLVVKPTIEITKMNTTDTYLLQDINIPYSIITDDTFSESSVTITLEPVRFEDRGKYRCIAEFNVTGVNGTIDPTTATYDAQSTVEDFELIVNFPPVTVNMSKEHNNILYVGTPFFLRCIIRLSDLVTIPIIVRNQWTHNNISLPSDLTNEATILEHLVQVGSLQYESSLYFNPLYNAHNSGEYYCNFVIKANVSDYYYVRNTSTKGNATINVENLPSPVVNIMTSGKAEPGEEYLLNCTVNVIKRLIVTPTIVWIKDNVNTSLVSDDLKTISVPSVLSNISNTMYSLSLFFSSLNTSDAGQYTCQATITVNKINVTTANSSIEDLVLQIPQPVIAISTHPVNASTLVEGTYLDIVCTVSLGDTVNTGVSVIVEWSHNGSSPLTNNSDYTISSVTMLRSDMYTSTLRIENLDSTRDNGTMYSCITSVLPSPVSSFNTGNKNEKTLSLIISDFSSDHVTSNIIFPTTPVAGDQFTMTCNIRIPETLVYEPSSVIWSYDLARKERVDVNNSDATIRNVTRIGNLILSTLTLNPVKTSDSGRYYCSSIFNNLGVSGHTYRDLNVQIPPPSMVVRGIPSTGLVYESTNFNLICTGTLPSVVDTPVSATVVWFDPQGNTIPIESRRIITDVTSNRNNEFESTLMFLPIDNGDHNSNFNDTGTYTCQMNISSSNPLIISGINNTTETITVQNLPDMQLNIVSVGSPEVGQNLNITCTVRVAERLVVKPTIEITKMNTTDTYLLQDINIPYSIITDDTFSESSVTITLEPVRFEDRGVYRCIAEFNVTGVNGTIDPTTATYDAQSTVEDFELIVNFPPVTVNMSKEHNNILYVGTPFFLRCIIRLSDLVTIPIIVRNQWTHNNISLPSGLTNEATILEHLVQVGSLQYESSLYFNPLYNAHNSGEYYCNFVIKANVSDYYYVRNTSTKGNATINVENLPSPVVNIMTSGKAEPGEEYLLNCTVNVIKRLIVTPTIVWIKDNVNTSLVSDDLKTISVPSVLSNISNTMYSLSLFFSSLNTSDAGQYTCQATITVNKINVTTANSSIEDLVLQIPQPVIAISTHPVNASTLVEGTYLDIVCTVSLGDTVNTGVSVIVEWSHNGSSPLTNNSDYTISSVTMLRSDMYTSTLRIENLDSTRDNGTMYSCITSVLPSPVSSFITGNKNEKTLSLIISDFSSDHVTSNIIFPTTPVAGDQFTMTCNIRIPETLVYEPSSVIWSYDLARKERVDVNNSDATIRNVTRIGNLILSTLTLNPVKTSDSGRYYCSSIFNNLGVSGHTYRDLNVQIPPPSMVVRGIPSTGLVYESTNFNLICTGTLPSVVDTPVSATVVWFDPQGNTIPIESRRIITDVTSNRNNEFESTLMFLPIDNGDHNSNFNDTGTYTCQMNISSSNPLIISGINNTTETITVQNLPDMQLNIVSVGSPEVGQNLNITCTVRVAERLVVKPTIEITKMNTTDTYLLQDINIPYSIITDDTFSESSVTITLEPVRFEDRGVYRCIAEFNVTGVNGTIDPTTATYDAQSTVEDFELIVNFPPVTVNMSKEHNNILYVGTPFFLRCIIRLSDLVTIPIIVRNQWTHNNISLPSGLTNEATILEHLVQVGSLQYESSLYFNPLYNAHNSGEYYCNFVIKANVSDYYYVRNTSTKGNATINVENLPSPVVNIMTSGKAEPGEEYLLNCTVNVIKRLIVTPTIVWIKDNVNTSLVSDDLKTISVPSVLSNISNTMYSLSLFFSSLNTSDAGQYTCQATITVNKINVTTANSSIEDLVLQIPQPVIAISTHPVNASTLVEGTYLDIVCTVSLGDTVNTGVSVIVEWSHNGSSPLTNNSDYTISSVTMLRSDMYTSTLRIENLDSTRDNGTMYSCITSVLPSPVSSFITGNKNEKTLSLIISDFSSDHVTSNIIFPTTPVAGDQFTMTCNIRIPETLVYEPSSVIWSYDLARKERVDVNNSDATIRNVTRIGNLILSTLTLNPVKTSDSGRYYCSSIFNNLGVSGHTYRDLNVQIPPPSMVVRGIPSTGLVYESTNFNLICTGTLPSVVDTPVSATVVWFDPQGNTIPIESRRIITDVTSNRNNEFESTLMFLPIDNGDHNSNFNDTGTYTCQMNISSSNPLIISGINNTTETITVQNLPDMQLNIVSVGSPEVGQNLNITCTVRVAERLVVKPTIEITKMNTTDTYLLQDINIPYSIITDDTFSESSVTITLEPVRFEDRGVYRCIAEFNVTGVNGTIDPTTATYDAQSTVEDFELIVNFPPVTVNMSKEHNNILYVGTPFFLRCIIRLSDLVTIPIIVRNQWTHNNISLPSGLTNEATILEHLVQVGSLQYESSLYFNPLYNAHNSGEYYCNFVIKANVSDYYYVRNTSTKGNATINVENLPSPVVNIMTSGKAEPGEEYLLNCTVNVIKRLIVTPTIVWIKDNVNTSLVSDDLKTISVPSVLSNISNTMYSLSLFFSSLNTSDAGQYTCQATITVNKINVTTANSSIEDLVLQIPQPVIAISTHPVNASTLVEGTYLDIVCTVSLGDTVNTGVSVIVEWSHNGSSPLTNNSDYTISSVTMLRSDMYTSTLRIENLDSTRDNGTMYSCITSVLPSPVSSFITGNKNEKTLSLIISDFSSDHVTSNIIFPTTPLAGDQFTMTCNIRIPETLVYEPSSVIWSYDLARKERVDVNNSDATIRNVTRIGNLILSTLTLNPVKTSDSGRYYCSSIFNNLGVSGHTYRDLNVQIPPPSMVVRGIPSTGLVYESTNFNLICTGTLPSVVDTPVSATVVWFDPQGNTIPIESRRIITDVTSNRNNEFESTLMFLPIDNGDHNSNFNDTGTYTCQMNISSSNPLIISGINNTTETITVQNLPDMQLNIVSVGSPEVGQNLNITCTVRVAERLVVKPTIEITKMNTTDTYLLQDINIPYSIITDDTFSESSVTITLEPVRFEDRGVYRCIAEFNVTGVNGTIDPTTATYDAQSTVEDFELIVNFPPVTVNMSKEHNNILYVGTPFFLRCIIRLSDLVTIPIIVRNQWTHNNISLPSGLTNEATILEHLVQVGSLQYESSLYFNPLYNAHNSGEYYCNFVIKANVSDYYYVRNTSTKGNATINVENLPSPVVNIMTSGKAEPGEEYLLNCTVNVIKRLIVTPTIVWIKDNVNTSLVSDDLKTISVPSVLSNISNTMYSLSLFFSSLNTSDAGQYTCQATITVNKINVTTANSSIEDLVLQIPQPVIAISTHPVNASTLVEGTYLDIVCTVSLGDTVNTGVSVIVEWSHNGSSPLTNNSDYTISSVTMLRSDMYTSTLRIENLDSTRDNGTMYSCITSVLPSPVSSFITGNKNEKTLSLIISDFSSDHVTSNIIFPTTPVAGDQFTMTCNIRIPETLVYEPSSVIWSYDLARKERVDVNNSDATIRNVTRIGNLILSTLTLNPVKTSDSGRYYCSSIFNNLGVSGHTYRDLNVQIPPPSMVVRGIPSTGLVYESTNFNLICTGTLPSVVDTPVSATVVWFDPQGNTIPIESRRIITDVTSNRNNEFESTLMFLPIDNGDHNSNFNDTGTYTCQMNISSSNPLIISGINNTTETITVQNLPDMQLNIVSVGSPEVGQNLNITCTVRVAERLVVKPTIEITKMNTTDTYLLQDINIPYSIITDDTFSESSVTITLEPVRFEDRGVYRCIAEFNVTGVNGTIDPTTATYDAQSTVEDFELIVNFPPVTVNMSKEHNNILYVGTPFFLRCIIRLSDLVTIPIIVRNQWTHNNISLPSGLTNEATILEHLVQVGSLQYESSLYFNPLYNAHNSGEYYCNFVIKANVSDYYYVRNTSTKGNATINVENLPSPVVNIMTSGKAEPGEEYLLNCTVNVIKRLIVTPTIVWIKDNVNTSLVSDDLKTISVPSVLSNISNTMYSLSLFFSSLNTSDAGQYTCQATITVNKINVTTANSSIEDLVLQIPQPVIAISTHPVNASTLVEGTYLDIVCTVSLGDTVNTGVSVIVEWSHNGSSPLTNNSDYTISSVTMLRSDMYTSTLRIENLDSTRDNGTMYSCITSVLPSPVSSFITGNKNEKTLSLIISDFSSDHVTSNIIFPTTPLAGDQFTMTCNIRIPETLVYEPSSVIWSYDLARKERVDVNNSDATIRNVTRIGNLILSTLTLNPVKTSDSGRYYCSSIFNNLGVSGHTYRDLNVQIPPPSMVVRGIPSTGLVYESTNFNLICTGTLPSVVDTPVSATVVWFDPQGNTIPIESRRIITDVTSNRNNEFESTLMFLPIDNGDHNSNFNDTGTYTCQMNISSSNPLIISGINNTTETITVQNLPDMQLNIVSVGSPEVGQNLNITCTVRVAERLVVKPTIEITKMNTTDTYLLQDINIPYSIITDDTFSESSVTITLEPVRFEDRGVYRCIAEFNVTGVNGTIDPTTATYDAQSTVEDFELIVNFPPVTVNMSKEHNNILYVGTPFFLRCIIRLSDLVTIPIIVKNQWTHNDISLPSDLINEATILEHLVQVGSLQYESSLYFNPLYNIHNSGEYYCNFVIKANVSDYHYVHNTSTKGNTTINVENLPSPVVNIMTSGKAVPGEEYLLNCTVNVIKRLIVTPTIVWIKDSVNTSLVSDDLKSINVPSVLSNISDTMYSLSLFFSSLNTSDAGQYTCQATITVNEINVTVTNASIQDLALQIPTPNLDIRLSRQSDYLAGSELTITCDITIDPCVNTPFIINTIWVMMNEVRSGMGTQLGKMRTTIRNGSGSDQSRILLNDPTETDFNTHHSQVQFSTLSSSMDSGIYTCSVDVIPIAGNTYINAANTSNITTNFTVVDPVIGGFATKPDSFLGLETSCSDSDPYDNFTLVCTASKPALVIPTLEVIWLHNGTVYHGVVTTQNDDTYVTNTLSFPTSTSNDSGTYTCIAKLTIPESPDISLTENSTVTLRPQRKPYPVIDVTSIVGKTNCTIYLTILSIAYTPEIYHINYIGLELQNTLTTSSSLVGTNNITAVNLMYQIILYDLEEANTYNFTVVSTNCFGNISSETMNFSTLAALPIAPPRNFINSTFLPRSVTLNWDPPVRVDQNGKIIGYNLTCVQTNRLQVLGLTDTQSSPEKMFTIPVLVPFTEYTCRLSSINVVGEGPATQYTFETAQDRPDDAPQNFTSTPTKTNVTFNWRHPITPNGVITQYRLVIVVNVGADLLRSITRLVDVTPNHKTISITIDGFSPYQNYTAIVSATTVVGYGPNATIKGRTDPDISSKPVLIIIPVIISNIFVANTIPVVNDTAVNLTWYPPITPNGYISSYNIDITGGVIMSLTVTADPQLNTYTQIIGGLRPGVPYYISIGAVNELEEGNITSVTVFTKTETPNISPRDIVSQRSSDGTSVYIVWRKVSLEEAHGFFEYIIVLDAVNSRRRQSSDITVHVPFNKTSINVTGLNPQLTYTLTMRIAVQNERGEIIEGPTSIPIRISSHWTPPASTKGGDSFEYTILGVMGTITLIVIIILVLLISIILTRRKYKKYKLGLQQRDEIALSKYSTINPLTIYPLYDEVPGSPEYCSIPVVDKISETNSKPESEATSDVREL